MIHISYGIEGTKVKILTVVGNMVGTITHVYPSGIYCPNFCWVRLENGFLLKDVAGNEIEEIVK